MKRSAAVKDGIKVQCVYDKKHEKTITFEEAQRGMPFCAVDGGPMIAVQATVTRKKSR